MATNPLTEADLAQLDDFLLSDHCPADALTVDEAHGFLTALAVTPESLPQAAWLEAIWGAPDFADAAQQAALVALWQRLVLEIQAALGASAPFEPLVAVEETPEGEELERYEGWCFGFMLAVERYPEVWGGLSKHGEGLLAPIAQIALLGDEEAEPMGEAEYQEWVELLPGAVMGLHRYWQAPT